MLIVLLLAVFMFEQKKLVISFLYTFVNWGWVYLEDHFFVHDCFYRMTFV